MELKTAGGYWSELLCFSSRIWFCRSDNVCNDLVSTATSSLLNFGSSEHVCVVSLLILRPAGGNEFWAGGKICPTSSTHLLFTWAAPRLIAKRSSRQSSYGTRRSHISTEQVCTWSNTSLKADVCVWCTWADVVGCHLCREVRLLSLAKQCTTRKTRVTRCQNVAVVRKSSLLWLLRIIWLKPNGLIT